MTHDQDLTNSRETLREPRAPSVKVLHVAASLSPQWGGPVAVLAGLTPALRAKGLECTVFAPKGSHAGTETISLDGVETRLFPTGGLAGIWTGYASTMAQALESSIAEYDIVHIHELWHFPHYAAFRAARKFRKPYIVTVHGNLSPWARRHKWLKKSLYMAAVQRRILQRAATLHAITADEAEHIRNLGLTAPISVIPNGIFTESVEPLPPKAEFLAKYPELDGKQIILFLGRIHPVKGLDILVEAFAKITRSRDDFLLVIAGPDEGGYSKQVEAMLRTEEVFDKVVFTGMLSGSDKLAALSAADIFVLPSYSEVMGIVALEAMACDLPVIITRQCQFPEVAEGGAGLVIDADAGQLEEALLRLLNSPEERRQMGRCGRKLVQERYTWDKIADQMRCLYESALDNAGAYSWPTGKR